MCLCVTFLLQRLYFQAQMVHDKALLLQQFASLGSVFSIAPLYREKATLLPVLICSQTDGGIDQAETSSSENESQCLKPAFLLLTTRGATLLDAKRSLFV